MIVAIVDTTKGYNDLFDVYWPIGVGVLVVIWLLLLGFVLRFRRRDGDDGGRPPQVHENPIAEGSYVVVLALVAAFLVYLTFSTMGRLKADLPAEAANDRGQADARLAGAPSALVHIDAIAARWNWRFDYRGLGISQAGDGTRIPTLVVPAGNVRFSTTSNDVIHSFFIPYLRFKRDAFPKRWTNFTLGFPQAGFHPDEGECAEYCGLRHGYMQFNVRVLPVDQFRAWVRDRQNGKPQQLTPALNKEGRFE